MSESLDDILKALGFVTKIANDITNTQLSKARLESVERERSANRLFQADQQKQRDDFYMMRDNTKDLWKENNKKIEELAQDAGNFVDVGFEYLNLDEKYLTEDGGNLVKDLGVEIRDDMSVRYKIANDSAGTIQNTLNAIELQNIVINQLSKTNKELDSMAEHEYRVGEDANIKLARDVEDYQAFVDTNPMLADIDDPATDIDESAVPLFPADKPWLKDKFMSLAPTDEEAVFAATKKLNYLKNLDEIKGLGDKSNKYNTSVEDIINMDVDSNILKQRLSASGVVSFSNLPTPLQGLIKPLNKHEFPKDFLSKGVGYSQELKNQEIHKIFSTVAGNIDRVGKYIYDKDAFKTPIVKTAYQEGAFKGNYQYGVDTGGLIHLIGKKDEEGALVKRSTAGEWYVPRNLLTSSGGLDFGEKDIGDASDKMKAVLAFEEQLIDAKMLQEAALTDPLQLIGPQTQEDIETQIIEALNKFK